MNGWMRQWGSEAARQPGWWGICASKQLIVSPFASSFFCQNEQLVLFEWTTRNFFLFLLLEIIEGDVSLLFRSEQLTTREFGKQKIFKRIIAFDCTTDWTVRARTNKNQSTKCRKREFCLLCEASTSPNTTFMTHWGTRDSSARCSVCAGYAPITQASQNCLTR